MPGFKSYVWYGFFAPGKTPKDVVAKLNAAAVKVMKQPEYQRVLAETGSEFVGDTPENFAAFVRAEAVKWAKGYFTVSVLPPLPQLPPTPAPQGRSRELAYS